MELTYLQQHTMKASVEVSFGSNVIDVNKKINRFAGNIINKKMLTNVANDEVKAIQHRITTSKESPSGKAWAPWSYATIKARQKDGTIARGKLYHYGKLLKSFRTKVSNKMIEIGTNVRYAKYLQFGTNKMPARPFMGWNKESKANFAKRLKEQIRKIK